MYVSDDHTTELPAVHLPPAPAGRGRLETMGLVAGSVLTGALLVCLLWWLNDPHIPRPTTALMMFMTLTSGAVVTLFYAMNRAMIRRGEERIVAAIEVQGQSMRAQGRDTQWQIAAGRTEARRSRQAIAMQIEQYRPTRAPRARKPVTKRAPSLDTEARWLTDAVEMGADLEREKHRRGEIDPPTV